MSVAESRLQSLPARAAEGAPPAKAAAAPSPATAVATTAAAAAPLEPLSLTGRAWAWPEQQLQPPAATGAVTPAFVRPLLRRRGIAEGEATARFLAPSLRHLEDPAAVADMDRALARLLQARAEKQKIWVYGDYDVDGVCATAVLMRFFAAAGMAADFYIPHRQKEGYGLNDEALAHLSKQGGLLVTVDCGSTSNEELAQARAQGLEAIVVDHHQVRAQLPDIVALLNPQRADCGYAGGVLCAAGLAFMLVVALRRALRAQDLTAAGADFDVRTLLDMVAVATVADMVPLVGINRVLVHAGLLRLQKQPACGLRALCEVARVAPEQLDAAALGFRLAPRINARGRMEHAGMGVRLMLADDAEEARAMAAELDAANEARRTLEKATVAQAVAQAEALDLSANCALVLYAPGWHAGVLGLVASRLSQKYFRPAVIVGDGGKGSARSVPGLNLVEALGSCADALIRFGGHPAAAGLTVDAARIPELRAGMHAFVLAAMGPAPYVPRLQPELEIDLTAVTMATCQALGALEPFGRDNPEVLLAARSVRVVAARIVGEDHLKLTLGEPATAANAGRGPRLDAIAFGCAHLLPTLPPRVDVLFYLERNVFRGETRLQARVVDLRAAAFAH